MRTRLRAPIDFAASRLRDPIDRARRLAGGSAAARWSVAAAGALLAVAAALSVLAAGGSAGSNGYVHVGSVDRFNADEKAAIGRALDAKHIAYSFVGRGRVAVGLDQLASANEAVAKLGVGPASFADVLKSGGEGSPWESPWSKEQRLEHSENAFVERLILGIDGIVGVQVKVNRPPKARGPRPGPKPTAFVWVETEDDGELDAAMIAKIQRLVSGAETFVTPDSVSVFDSQARQYADALDPAVEAQARGRALVEEYERAIRGELPHLKGLQVSVHLAAPEAAPLPAAPAGPPPAEEVSGAPPSVGVNQPLELTPAPAPPAAPKAPAAPAPAAPATAGSPAPPRVRVWVKVPSSYYVAAFPDRDPGLDEIRPLRERTEETVKQAVRHVIPAARLEEPVVVSTVPDELPAVEAPAPAPADPRRWLSWWASAGLAGGATAVVLALAFRALASRRPPLRAASDRVGPPRYKIDEAHESGPGPSERVRELIRLNPEAAASVLHRWTGQGGTLG